MFFHFFEHPMLCNSWGDAHWLSQTQWVTEKSGWKRVESIREKGVFMHFQKGVPFCKKIRHLRQYESSNANFLSSTYGLSTVLVILYLLLELFWIMAVSYCCFYWLLAVHALVTDCFLLSHCTWWAQYSTFQTHKSEIDLHGEYIDTLWGRFFYTYKLHRTM